MSIRSRKIELAVSIPPAPRPMIVCVPDCSDVKEIAFNVPLTHKGMAVKNIHYISDDYWEAKKELKS